MLGSSGSIGKNTVRVLEQLADRFETVGLAVKSSVETVAEQARKLGCKHIAASDSSAYEKLKCLAPAGCQCSCGEAALVEMASRSDVDIVVCAIVGTGGLLPVLAALQANKRVALASKEVMVMAGDLVNAELDAGHGEIIPVDSEHSAIFQCLDGCERESINKLIITASGGAFRDWKSEDLVKATWRDALAHPVWSMGSKITIDSATLMNKALEIVEAGRLFRMDADKIDTVIHPQSLIHSMVEFVDGSVMAQLSKPDMRFAIQYAMTYPQRVNGALEALDFRKLGKLEFAEVDRAKYPSVDMAYAALRAGGTLPAVMNAANEEAVSLFLKEKIRLPQLFDLVEEAVDAATKIEQPTLEQLIEADAEGRRFVCAHAKTI